MQRQIQFNKLQKTQMTGTVPQQETVEVSED